MTEGPGLCLRCVTLSNCFPLSKNRIQSPRQAGIPTASCPGLWTCLAVAISFSHQTLCPGLRLLGLPSLSQAFALPVLPGSLFPSFSRAWLLLFGHQLQYQVLGEAFSDHPAQTSLQTPPSRHHSSQLLASCVCIASLTSRNGMSSDGLWVHCSSLPPECSLRESRCWTPWSTQQS